MTDQDRQRKDHHHVVDMLVGGDPSCTSYALRTAAALGLRALVAAQDDAPPSKIQGHCVLFFEPSQMSVPDAEAALWLGVEEALLAQRMQVFSAPDVVAKHAVLRAFLGLTAPFQPPVLSFSNDSSSAAFDVIQVGSAGLKAHERGHVCRAVLRSDAPVTDGTDPFWAATDRVKLAFDQRGRLRHALLMGSTAQTLAPLLWSLIQQKASQAQVLQSAAGPVPSFLLGRQALMPLQLRTLQGYWVQKYLAVARWFLRKRKAKSF